MSVRVGCIANCLAIVNYIFAQLLIYTVRFYQLLISPMLGQRCRFYPSCSNYAISCLKSYPIATALAKTTLRICKCHPAHPGGVDLP